jgi:hypothetical protein
MKCLSSMILLVPAICVAQTPEPAQAPVITFAKTHYDFGKIAADRKVSCRYQVTNTGKAFLNITRVDASCGCTYTMLGKWSLAPGESTEVEATFNPGGFRGIVRKSLQVTSNDPANPRVTLTFEAEVIQEVTADPSSLFLADVLRTGTRKSTVRLKSGSGKPVQVKETKAPGAPYLSTSVRGDGNDALLDVVFDGQKVPVGKRVGADSLTVITTNDKVINIFVQWDMKPSVVATPERVGWVDGAGKEHQAAVILKQVDGKPFRVTSAKPTHPAIRVEGLGKPSAAQQELQIVFGSSAKPGTYNESVVLTLDDPNQSEITIRVTAVLR